MPSRARSLWACFQARREEREIVLEGVAVGGLGEQLGPVAATLKARAVAVLVRHRLKGLARLHLAGVERRVDVDELEGLLGEPWQELEVVAEQDLVGPRGFVWSVHVREGYVHAPMERSGMQYRAATA